METPIGYVPTPESLDLTGLDVPDEDLRAALRVDVDEWRAEVPQIVEWFEKFGDKLPGVLWAELDALKARLGMEMTSGRPRGGWQLTVRVQPVRRPTRDAERPGLRPRVVGTRGARPAIRSPPRHSRRCAARGVVTGRVGRRVRSAGSGGRVRNQRESALRLYERRLAASWPASRAPPRRGDGATVTAAGPGRWGTSTQRRAPGRRGADAGTAALVRRGRDRARHGVAAVHRQPQPSSPGAGPAAADHRGPGDRAGRRRAAWRLRLVGALDLLPAHHASAFKAAQERTVDRTGGAQVNMAICYSGRREIADAVRSLLHEYAQAGKTMEEVAEMLDVDQIASTCTPRGSPTRTWSSAPAASSGFAGSCCGSRRTRSSTSATSTGPGSGGWTSCGRCGATPTGSVGSASNDNLYYLNSV